MRDTVVKGEHDATVPYHVISLISRGVTIIRIVKCTFQRVNEAVAVSIYRKKLLLKIEQCHFKENFGQSILLSFSAQLQHIESRIDFEELTFSNNDAGFASSLHLIRSFGENSNDNKPAPHILLSNSTFENNYAEAFFGAIYAEGVDLVIKNTTFYNNSAGNEESSIQAFGGAIFVESRTNVKVFNSSFIGNTCSGFGGAVFSRGNFSAINSFFRGTLDDATSPLLGDILYVTAGLQLENTTWHPSKSFRSNSAIWHPGSPKLERWSICIKGYFHVLCPVGHNITGHGLLRKSGMSTDRISMGCRSCPRDEYSLQSGQLRVVSTGSEIVSKSEKNVSCMRCRYGGVCEKGRIKARSNYYGYLTGDSKEVKFISCPYGYCCQGRDCRSYNSCSPLRQGTLCGSCIEGTTENLLNAKCVQHNDCRDRWFWFLYFPFGITYILFFMYIDKISKFLKGQLLWWESKIDNTIDSKSNSKGETKSESKSDSNIESKKNSKIVRKKDSKDESKIDSKDESKIDSKVDSKSKSKNDDRKDNKHFSNEEVQVSKIKAVEEHDLINNDEGETGEDEDVEKKADNLESTEERQTLHENKSANELQHDHQLIQSVDSTNKEDTVDISPNRNEDRQNSGAEKDQYSQIKSMEYSKEKSDVFSDIINITFYFYQMIFVIRDHDNALLTKTFAFIKEISNSFFTFSIGSKSVLSLCPLQGLTPVSKSILVRSIAIYVIAMILLMNVANSIYSALKNNYNKTGRLDLQEIKFSFSVRLRVTTIHVMLLAYSTITNMVINFVNCVPVNGNFVLYMDGTVNCFNWSQLIALIFVIFWIVPFPFALVIGIHCMHIKTLSYHEFIFGLLFPFCYVFWYTTRKCLRHYIFNDNDSDNKECRKRLHDENLTEKISVEEVLRRFEAPFKDHGEQTSLSKQPGIWQGVMIMRRLIIILLFTFVNSPVTRLYCIFIACLFFLMHHLIYLPYKNNLVNIVETCSSTILVVFCSVNLFFAYSYVSNVPPEHADNKISDIFNWLEVIILVFFPVLFFIVLILFIVGNCCRAIYKGCNIQ